MSNSSSTTASASTTATSNPFSSSSSSSSPASSTSSFSPNPAQSSDPSQNTQGGTSSSLYLFTFLATLFLLLCISCAIVLRSFVLRRRFRRRIEEALAAGVILPPGAMPYGGRRRNFGEKPKMYEAFIQPTTGHRWEDIQPIGVGALKRPKRSSSIPAEATSRSAERTQRSNISHLLPPLLFRWRRTSPLRHPSPPPLLRRTSEAPPRPPSPSLIPNVNSTLHPDVAPETNRTSIVSPLPTPLTGASFFSDAVSPPLSPAPPVSPTPATVGFAEEEEEKEKSERDKERKHRRLMQVSVIIAMPMQASSQALSPTSDGEAEVPDVVLGTSRVPISSQGEASLWTM